MFQNVVVLSLLILVAFAAFCYRTFSFSDFSGVKIDAFHAVVALVSFLLT